MHKFLPYFLLILFSISRNEANSQTPSLYNGALRFNDAVNTQTIEGNSMFVGGAFTAINAKTGPGAMMNMLTNQAVLSNFFPLVNGTIKSITPDGSGGYFVGGLFTITGISSEVNLARVNSSGTVLPITSLSISGQVNKIIVTATKAYVVGAFGARRVNLATNTQEVWDEQFMSSVINDGLVYDNKLYLGGRFYNGSNYKPLARYDLATGNLDAGWNPSISSSSSAASINNAVINTMIMLNTDLVFGGTNMFFVGGLARQNLAGINLSTNSLSTLQVQFNSSVYSLAISGTNLFVGGAFSSYRNSSSGSYSPKYNLAVINLNFGQVTNAWSPNPNSIVYALQIYSDQLFVGGGFTTTSGQSISRLALYSNSSSALPIINPAFSPNPNSIVYGITLNGTTMIACGSFTEIEYLKRNRIAEIDISTGLPTSFNASVDDGQVYSIAILSGNIYIGGSFTSVGSSNRSNFAVVNNLGQIDNAIIANFNNTVRSLCVQGSNVFAGGDFNMITTPLNATQETRNYLASFTVASGAAVINSSFNANLSSPTSSKAVNVVKLINGFIYIGGQFSAPRNKLAMLSSSTGAANVNFDAQINGSGTDNMVNDIIQVSATQIAIGGYFGSGFNQSVYVNNNDIGPGADGGLAILSYTLGTLSQRSLTSGEVSKLVKAGSSSVEFLINTGGLSSFNLTSGNVTSVVSNTGNMQTMAFVNQGYCFGGTFDFTMSGLSFKNLGFISFTPPQIPTLDPTNFQASNITYRSMTLSWTNGNGARRIVLARASVPPASNPVNGNAYTADTTYGNGPFIGGAQVIYDGTGSSVNLSNLNPLTTYNFRVYEYNGTSLSILYASTYLSGTGTTTDFPTPSVGSSSINYTNIGQTSMQVNWTRGDGQNCLVVVKEGSPVDFVPNKNTQYSYSTSFGAVDLGSRNYGVYKGSDNNVTIFNLVQNTTYYVAIYEFNQSGVLLRYNTTSVARSSQKTSAMATTPTVASSNMVFQNMAPTITNVSWTNGNGVKRILLAVQGEYNLVPEVITNNGESYQANANLSSFSPLASSLVFLGSGPSIPVNYVNAKVVYNGSGNSVAVSGLLPNTDYSYILVEYNELVGTSNSEAYLYNLVLLGSKKTDPNITAPSLSASNARSVESNSAMRINWTNGNGNNRIVVVNQSMPVTWTPSANTNYTANTDYTLGTDLGSGQKVVYNGSGTTVDISGLNAYTNYYFAIYEFNSVYNNATSSTDYAYKVSNPATLISKTAAPNWPRVAGGSESDAAGSVVVDASGNVYVSGTVRGNSNFGMTQVAAQGNDIFLAKYNSSGELLWLRTAGGTSDDASSSVILDGSGNPYIAGSFRGVAYFDTLSITSAGSDDGFLAKYNASGNIQWVRSFGSDSQDVANALAIDASGNIILAGYLSGNTNFSNSATTLGTNGKSDILIAKYNSSGSLLWARSAGSPGYDFAFGVATDISSNIYVCGEIKGIATFGSVSTNYSGLADIFLAKYDNTGTVQYANNYGNSGDDKGMALDVDVNGQVYLVGAFSGAVSFGANLLTSNGITDGFIVKINGTNGTPQWAKQQGGISQDIAGGVDIGSNGEIFVTGGFGGSANFETQVLNSAGNLDIFVAIYTANGLLNEAKRYGGPLDDAARGIYAISPNNTYISGYFNASATFGGFDVYTKVQPIPPAGNWDLFVHNIGSTYNNDPSVDLVAWYRCNGNANDFSGNAYHGTIVSTGGGNTVTSGTDRSSVSGNAYDFAGRGKIDFNLPTNPNHDNLNELTVMAWVKASNFIGPNYVDRCILATDARDGMSFNLFLTKDQGIFGQFFDASGNPVGAASSANYAYQSGTWSHIAITYENGIQSRVLLDGNVVGTVASFSNAMIDLSNRNYNIGAFGETSGATFNYFNNMNGSLDDVRIYKKALTAIQIQDIMASTPNLSIPPPQESSKPTWVKNGDAQVWPNPSNGELNFEMTLDKKQNIRFSIIDISGKSVYTEDAAEYESGVLRKSFDLHSLKGGFYTLQVINGNEISNHKLILNN